MKGAKDEVSVGPERFKPLYVPRRLEPDAGGLFCFTEFKTNQLLAAV